MNRPTFDDEARHIQTILPQGPRLVVIGSGAFWHEDSEETCIEVGRGLAKIAGLILVTGGVGGVGETIGRSFHQARQQAEATPLVFHVLPEQSRTWDYGETLFAGRSMDERREVLGRLARIYLAIEGGPGTAHEAEVARSRGSTVIPVGRSGGHAGELYTEMERPDCVDAASWATLGSGVATPAEIASTIETVIVQCLGQSD